MGGNLFQCRRYSTEEFEDMKVGISDLLEEHDVEFAFIPYISKKESHGDLDVIVTRESLSDNFLEYMANHYDFCINGKVCGLKDRSNIDVFSFLEDELQVDLIVIDAESFEFAVHYHSFNDLGGIIGSCIRPLGFVLSREGLYYSQEFIPSTGAQKIYLTKDFFEFLSVFELDNSIYSGHNTIRDIDHMVDFLREWKYFNVDYADPSQMNSRRKHRAGKRKVIQAFFDEVKARSLTSNYSASPELFESIKSCFDREYLARQINEAEDKAKEVRRFVYALSSDRVRDVLGYLPENVGQVFSVFAKMHSNPKQAAFDMSDSEFKETISSLL